MVGKVNLKRVGGFDPGTPAKRKDDHPFYWVAPPQERWPGWHIAPTGWYQWTQRGLIYLGPSLLEK